MTSPPDERALQIASATATGAGTVRLGAGGTEIYPLCLGGNVFGWTSDTDQSFAVLDAFFEAGGNFVDTADQYSAWVDGNSGGESETILGRWLADRRASGALHVATKTGKLPGADLSPSSVDRSLDASLGRLQVDAVELYYAHRDEPDRPVEEIARTFGSAVTSGRAAAWGLSNWSADRIAAVVAAAREAGLPAPVALQNLGNAIEPTDPAEVAAADDAGLLQLPYSTLASGFLTGKYSRDGDLPESRRVSRVEGRWTTERGWAVLDAVRAVADANGVAAATVALAWLRARGTVPIASARTPEQVAPLMAVERLELSADEIRSITDAGRR